MNDIREWVCPYLGLADDRETALSFPSHRNLCFHVKPAALLALEHQNSYCLSPSHLNCEAYQANPASSLRHGVRSHPHGDVKRKKSLFGIGLSLGVVVLVLVLVWLGVLHGFLGFPGIEQAPANRTPTALTKPNAMIPIQPTRTKAMATRTSPPPTFTASPIPPTLVPAVPISRTLETPIGRNPPLIIHRVQDGESLDLYCGQYGTTIEAILAINYSIWVPLLTNFLVIIPFQQVDVENLPAFQAFQVQAESSVEVLSVQLGADLALLKKYNDLGEGDILKQGDWVLVPYVRTAIP
jgi:hypothetical protein